MVAAWSWVDGPVFCGEPGCSAASPSRALNLGRFYRLHLFAPFLDGLDQVSHGVNGCLGAGPDDSPVAAISLGITLRNTKAKS